MRPYMVTNFFLIKPTDALISQIYFVKKHYMFWAVPLPIIRSFPLYIRHWYMSCSFQAWLVMLESCHQTCMTYTSAECTVENWWRAEELPQTCRISWQNKFGKLVRLWFYWKENRQHILQKCDAFICRVRYGDSRLLWYNSTCLQTYTALIMQWQSVIFFSFKPTDALVSKFFLVQNSTCFG